MSARHDDRYGGMMDVPDAVWAAHERLGSPIRARHDVRQPSLGLFLGGIYLGILRIVGLVSPDE